jgi:hypothetical protein
MREKGNVVTPKYFENHPVRAVNASLRSEERSGRGVEAVTGRHVSRGAQPPPGNVHRP